MVLAEHLPSRHTRKLQEVKVHDECYMAFGPPLHAEIRAFIIMAILIYFTFTFYDPGQFFDEIESQFA